MRIKTFATMPDECEEGENYVNYLAELALGLFRSDVFSIVATPNAGATLSVERVQEVVRAIPVSAFDQTGNCLLTIKEGTVFINTLPNGMMKEMAWQMLREWKQGGGGVAIWECACWMAGRERHIPNFQKRTGRPCPTKHSECGDAQPAQPAEACAADTHACSATFGSRDRESE